MSVNGPISPKQCYYEMDYSFYSFYWLDSLEIRLDHNSTYYRSLSKNSDVKPRISHCDSQNLQYKAHPDFWPSHRRIFKTSLYYKTRLILETRRYISSMKIEFHLWYENYRRHFQIYLNESVWIPIPISLKFVPKGPIDYNSALVQVVAWHRTGEKPLPLSMLTQFTDACIRH